MVISYLGARELAGLTPEERLRQSGGVAAIISQFLVGELHYLGRREHMGRQVLIAMATTHGSKAQRSMESLARELGTSLEDITSLIQRLTGMRLVRAVDDKFELVHDYLARTILAELATPEEREAKMFKELLASRAAAFPATGALLTEAEHLRVFRHRREIVCTENEVMLLLRGYLAETGPAHYWLKDYANAQMRAWLHSMLPQLDARARSMADRLLIKLGETLPLEEAAAVWNNWEDRSSLAHVIPKVATQSDRERLVILDRSKYPEVADAARATALQLITRADDAFLERLAKSRSAATIDLLSNLGRQWAVDMSRGEARRLASSRSRCEQVLGLSALGQIGKATDIEFIERIIQRKRRLSRVLEAEAKEAVVRLASRARDTERVRSYVGDLTPKEFASPLLLAISRPMRPYRTRDLLEIIPKRSYDEILTQAVQEWATPRDANAIRKALLSFEAESWSVAELLLALAQVGESADFEFILSFCAGTRFRISYSDYAHLAEKLARLATPQHRGQLRALIDRQEFWIVSYDELFEEAQQLGVANVENLHLYRRLVGLAFCGLATRREWTVLGRLAGHHYWTIRHAAARALIRLTRSADMDRLVDLALTLDGDRDEIRRAICNLDEQFSSADTR